MSVLASAPGARLFSEFTPAPSRIIGVEGKTAPAMFGLGVGFVAAYGAGRIFMNQGPDKSVEGRALTPTDIANGLRNRSGHCCRRERSARSTTIADET
ncbi:hypothetical protein [Flavisphingomonas formosensis]|uniref:hypothetical protein n=1 Tax=Flavisphingomonas formosensis TaxID=861534 RepID=UPI0012F76E40|nr:hypothetical protein [Sphingomonas formosensis]